MYNKEYYQSKKENLAKKIAKSKDNIISEMVRIQNAGGIAINTYFEQQRDYDERMTELIEMEKNSVAETEKKEKKQEDVKEEAKPEEEKPIEEPKNDKKVKTIKK